MVKFTAQNRLAQKDRERIITDLCRAIASTRNSKEAAQLLTDLLGRQELEMIAKRLKVAELLLADNTYVEICKTLRVSPPTIARVNTWLHESGEGYRLVLERTKDKRKSTNNEIPSGLPSIKRNYPMYFWPQALLKHWVENATLKERLQMKAILDKLGDKRKLYRELDKLL